MRGLDIYSVSPLYGIAGGLRSCFLVAVLFQPFPAAAEGMEITKPEECAPAIARDPAAAREAAAVWSRLGGGASARLCEAAALEALGAYVTAAQLLTALGENDNRALLPEARAAILVDAGRLWLIAQRPDLTRQTLASADRITPATPDRLVLLSRAEAAEADWTAAEASLRTALVARPDDALALALHAATLRHLGQAQAALAEAQRAASLDPKLPEALFETGAALKARGNVLEAQKVWLRLIEEQPDSDMAALARQNLAAEN